MVTLKITFKGKGASKKNSQHIVTNKATGRQYIVQHKRYKRWVALVRPQVQQFMDKQAAKYGFIYPLAHVKLRIRMYFPDLKVRDGVGREQALLDMLVSRNLLYDDGWTNCDSVHWDAFLDRERPRIEVYIVIVNAEKSEWMQFLKEKSKSKRLRSSTTISTPIPIE
jgi:hypothetical protein